jgi:hypothetical protein
MRVLAGSILSALLIAPRALLAQPAGAPSAPDTGEPEEAQETAEPEAETQPTAKPRALPGDEEEDKTPEPVITPPAENTLAGHVMVSAGAAWIVPFGSLESGVKQTDFLDGGPGFGLDIGIGASRVAVLGVWGQFLSLSSSDACPDCSASSFAVGPFVRYHLVQGLRFDPWLSAGIGFRSTTLRGTSQGNVSYRGIEWLRLQVGGDWYPAGMLGIGPVFELDMGIYSSKEASGVAQDPSGVVDDSLGDVAPHWQFITGLRLTLDIPGRR